MLFQKLFLALSELFFPSACRCCGRKLLPKEQFLCDDCSLIFPQTFQCDTPYDSNFVRSKFEGVKLEKCCCYFRYSKISPFSNIVREIKFGRDIKLGLFMGEHFGRQLVYSEEFEDIDFIVPIPLHIRRTRKRGYNQSEIIAKGMKISMNIPICTTAIKRIRNTKPQASFSNHDKRKQNMANAFRVVDTEVFKNKHILIVDDVVTSGNTMIYFIAELRREYKDIRISIAALSATTNVKDKKKKIRFHR